MGGPCYIVHDHKKVLGPAATDNFQIISFKFPPQDGPTWHSAEQCYQAQKYAGSDSEVYSKIQSCQPIPGESDWQYGMRVWSLGQRGTPRPDWESIKVEIMYLVNCAKFACNPHIHQELLETSEFKLIGGPSTWQWSVWNGRIQMLIRIKLQRGINLIEETTVSHEELKDTDQQANTCSKI